MTSSPPPPWNNHQEQQQARRSCRTRSCLSRTKTTTRDSRVRSTRSLFLVLVWVMAAATTGGWSTVNTTMAVVAALGETNQQHEQQQQRQQQQQKHQLQSSAVPTGGATDPNFSSVLMDRTLVSAILQAPIPFWNADEEVACRNMILELTEQEQEVAARTSYAYLVYSVTTAATIRTASSDDDDPYCLVSPAAKSRTNETDTSQSAAIDVCHRNDYNDVSQPAAGKQAPQQYWRMRMALREARRHYVGQGRSFEKALESLRRTIDFRIQWNVDILRSLAWPSNLPLRNLITNSQKKNCDGAATIEEKEKHQANLRDHYRRQLFKDLSNQLMVVRGHDRMNRAILLKTQRLSAETDPSAYTIAQIYMAEKAIACTEALTPAAAHTSSSPSASRTSRNAAEQLVAIFDFSGYSSAHAPPTSVTISVVQSLQQCYPERLAKLFILDAPLWMRGLYTLVYPFLARETQQKIHFLARDVFLQQVSSNSDHENSLKEEQWMDSSLAPAFLLPNGELKFSDVSIPHLIDDVPFHVLYDPS